MIKKGKKILIVSALAIFIIVSGIFLFIPHFSLEDMEISESWAVNKFREETGLTGKDVMIDSVKRYGGQAIIFATLSNKERTALEKRFVFVSDKEFLKEYYSRKISYIPIFNEIFNIDSATSSPLSLKSSYLYYLKTYTNRSGFVATSYYITILPVENNKIMFIEAFFDL